AERIGRGERSVAATLYHLVPRGMSIPYQDALEPLRADFPGPGFIVSGPWPPFAFAPELWA
ncbi:MAG: GvpL/GvpF family gas vesicle protein, partial [Thermoanaerobaculia bacterium]